MFTSIGTGLLSPMETSLTQVEELKFTELSVKPDASEVLDSDYPLWWTAGRLLAFGY